MKREFEYRDARSAKFWHIELSGQAFTVRFGRIGTQGQTRTKEFDSADAARLAYEKLIREKLGEGYREITGGSAGAGGSAPAATTVSAAAAAPAPAAAAAAPGAQAAPARMPAGGAPAAGPGAGEARLVQMARLAWTKAVAGLKANATETAAAGDSPVAAAPAAAPPQPDLAIGPGAPDRAPLPDLAHLASTLGLEPIDWFWAPWRHTPALPTPEIPAFDQSTAAQRLAQVPASPYNLKWRWDKAAIPLRMTRQEAHFWLLAFGQAGSQKPPQALAQELARARLTGRLREDDIVSALYGQGPHHCPEVVLPLASLLRLDELDDLLLSADYRAGRQGAYWPSVPVLVRGFRRYVLPYLSAEERERAGARIAPHLDPAAWPGALYIHGPIAYYLAACLGRHAEVRALVERWPDDLFVKQAWAAPAGRPLDLVFGLGDADQVEYQARRLRLQLYEPELIRGWLAHTGCAALDVVRDSVLGATNKEESAELLAAFAQVVAPEAAPQMLQLTLAAKTPQLARAWLEGHPAHSVVGLLPLAAGRGRLAEAAVDMLQRLARREGAALIEAGLASLPPGEAATLQATLLSAAAGTAGEPLDEAQAPAELAAALRAARAAARRRKPPDWVTPADLPPLTVADRALTEEQGALLLQALQRSKVDKPDPLALALRAHADPATRDRFAWQLCQRWLADGAPARENWALHAVGLLGGDGCVLELAALVRVWPGEAQHQRAVLGLECLRAIGSDAALMQINGIAQKVKFKGLQQRAVECLDLIAAERGLSRPQLEDRIVPTCELDARGSRLFDYGPRRFRFALGPDLKPMVRDEAGVLRPDLPKPNSKDDAGLAAQAQSEWKLLKKQVAEVAKVQAVRLEQAMVTGRRWTPQEFETLLVRHPLLTHLVRTLIWGTFDAGGRLASTFRVTEDLTYADSADEPYRLAGDCAVGLAHPLLLGDVQSRAWGQLLGDYEILPPFQQLGRSVHALLPGEAQATDITRFASIKVPAPTLVFTLEKLGWMRGMAQDGGLFYEHSKPFYGANITAIVNYEDGVPMAMVNDWHDQRVTACYFIPGIYKPHEWYPTHSNRLRLDGVDPVVVSEVLRDLSGIAARGA